MSDELARLQEEIRAAFPPTRFYGAATACSCKECTHISENLRNKAWDEIPAEFIDFTNSPTLFTPEAVQAFLAAYLLRGLDDLAGKTLVLEFTVYSLCPHDPDERSDSKGQNNALDYVLSRLRVMSPAQITAVRSFLLFVRDHAEDGEWLQRYIDPALESVWLA